MKQNKKNREGIVYSTDPDFQYKYENQEELTLPNGQQNLQVCIDKHRAGKTAIIIKGFVGSAEDLNELSKLLKQKCGVGGSSKNGEIIIQGNVRDKILAILEQEGFRCKRVGG